jgi:hypothetical protein
MRVAGFANVVDKDLQSTSIQTALSARLQTTYRNDIVLIKSGGMAWLLPFGRGTSLSAS